LSRYDAARRLIASIVVLDEGDLWLCFLNHSLNFLGTGKVYLDTRLTEALDAYRLMTDLAQPCHATRRPKRSSKDHRAYRLGVANAVPSAQATGVRW
jgi:hypothetical protein